MAWFGWLNGARRHQQQMRDIDDRLKELADRSTQAYAMAESLRELVAILADRLDSIEQATAGDHEALEKVRLSLVRLEAKMHVNSEQADKATAALLERIETYRVRERTV